MEVLDSRSVQNTLELNGSNECYVEISDEGEEHLICDGEVYNELAPVPEPKPEPKPEQEVLRIDFIEGTEELTSSLLEELSEELLVSSEKAVDVEERGFVEDAEGQAEPDEDCLELAEREVPRLQLTREADGFKASLLVAQGQDELIAVSLTSSLARFSLDLGAFSRLLNELTSEKEELSINVTGAISLEMDTSVANRATFRVHVPSSAPLMNQEGESRGRIERANREGRRKRCQVRTRPLI